MKIIGIEANVYENDGSSGVEVLARFIKDGEVEMTACVSDYEEAWSASVGYGFVRADDEPWDETVCEYDNCAEAFASDYGKIFEMMSELSKSMRTAQ